MVRRNHNKMMKCETMQSIVRCMKIRVCCVAFCLQLKSPAYACITSDTEAEQNIAQHLLCNFMLYHAFKPNAHRMDKNHFLTHTDRVEAKMNNLLNFSSANYASIDYGGIMRECETKNSTIQTKTKAQQPNTFTEIHIFNAPSFVRSFIRSPDYALLSVYAGLHVAIAKTDTKCKRQWKTNMLQIPKRV